MGLLWNALRDTLYTGTENGNIIVGYPQKVLEGEEPSF